MALAPATQLGPYQILSSIGAGGMGEVYKARDARLERIVAVKILPEAVAHDAQFRERFDREARALSQLDHPHICTLYDVGEDRGTSYLVMQYLEGETLEERLKKGALPLDQALKTGMEIASALDTAHRAGIIHRDLKPANVILTKTGAKLLDFGLAKASAALTTGNVSHLVTAPPAGLTSQGMILGTFQYMAPEQIEGEHVDARTDIFAFGAVLYEMLTGRKAFVGKSQASLLGAILGDDPPPVSQVQPMTPPALEYLVRTCLAKEPDSRFQTARDVWLQLRWIAEGGSAVHVPAPVTSRRRSRERTAWMLAAAMGLLAVGAGALAVLHLLEQPAVADPVQFTIVADENYTLGAASGFALSPDGRRIAFVARASKGALASASMLWVRPLGALTARPLADTEGAVFPFWSPDGRRVGFFASGRLKIIDVAGGPSSTLCAVEGNILGGTWNRDNVIVFASSAAPLQKIDASGGTPAVIPPMNAEESPRWPSFLPDGQHLLYVSVRGTVRELRVASLASGETSAVGPSDSNGFYASGRVLFVQGGTLVARPFDLRTRQVTGDPYPVAEQVSVSRAALASFSISDNDVLAYWRGGTRSMYRLVWTDRGGKRIRVVGDVATYHNLSLSPDERRVAVSMTPSGQTSGDVWVIDMAREDTASRLTFDSGMEGDPVWSPDGSQIVFNSDRSGVWNRAFLRSSDGGGDDVPLVTMGRLFDSPDWSHDGRSIVFTGGEKDSSNDLWLLPLSGERKPRPFLQTPFAEDSPAFSPDDRWIAYNSNATGRFEVYVRSSSGAGGQFQISRDGGWAPRWRGDGKEIFFLALDGTMMAADITLGATVQAGVPRALFPTPLLRSTDKHIYAVSKDGQRFLLRVPDERQLAEPLTMVLNWPGMTTR